MGRGAVFCGEVPECAIYGIFGKFQHFCGLGRGNLVFPRKKEKVKLVKRYTKIKFLVAYRKTERIRTRRSIYDFFGNAEIAGQLIDLIFLPVSYTHLTLPTN